MKRLSLFAVSILLAVAALSGCASFVKLVTPAAAPFVQAAADIAVATAVGTDPATEKARATQIKAIAQQVLAADKGIAGKLALASVEADINAAIAKLNLPPADVAAAQILSAALAVAVQLEISNVTNGVLTPTTQVAVATIAGYVITATAAYGA